MAEKHAFKLAAEKSQQDLSVWIRIQLYKAAENESPAGDTSPIIVNGVENAKNDGEHSQAIADRIGVV